MKFSKPSVFCCFHSALHSEGSLDSGLIQLQFEPPSPEPGHQNFFPVLGLMRKPRCGVAKVPSSVAAIMRQPLGSGLNGVAFHVKRIVRGPVSSTVFPMMLFLSTTAPFSRATSCEATVLSGNQPLSLSAHH